MRTNDIEKEILMHLRSLKKTRKDVSLHDPIGSDKEGNEITLIDILGSDTDDVIKEVDLKIEKSKIYRNLDILDDREKRWWSADSASTPEARSGHSAKSPRSWASAAATCRGSRSGLS
ncbi:hypothetical protein PUR_15460 [Paenibacillus sp. URB8-2]|nr:hypothetical protein PUR_15460 [Paenibacillus sp. URB8-2]